MKNLSNITITKKATSLSIMDGDFKMLLSELIEGFEFLDVLGIEDPKRYQIEHITQMGTINLGLDVFARLEDDVKYVLTAPYRNQLQIIPAPVVSENYKKLAAMFK